MTNFVAIHVKQTHVKKNRYIIVCNDRNSVQNGLIICYSTHNGVKTVKILRANDI
jgi:hypothetical protein